jgi:hypothetical protein
MFTSLGSPLTQKLTWSNFLFWKTLVLPTPCSAHVLDLLHRYNVVPVKTMEVEDQDKKKIIVLNPAYLAWVSRDQMVLGFLENSLSPEILAHVVDLETSAEI